MHAPETTPAHGELADTENGETGLPREAVPLYWRLRVLAGLLRDAPPGEGPRLLWRGPNGKVQARMIAGVVTSGRSRDCDIVLAAPKVSRRHCRIWNEGDRVWVKDLGSTTGTLVNGRPISGKVLHDGDFLEVGGVSLAYIHDG